MAITKKEINRIQSDDSLESTHPRETDQDFEENIDRIIDEIETNKANKNGDPNRTFKVADPEQNDHAVNKRTADTRYFSEEGIQTHIDDTTNPHDVDKTDIGLDQVENKRQTTPTEAQNHYDLDDETTESPHGTGTVAFTDTGIGLREIALNQDLFVNNEELIRARAGVYSFLTDSIAFPNNSHFFSVPVSLPRTGTSDSLEVNHVSSDGQFFFYIDAKDDSHGIDVVVTTKTGEVFTSFLLEPSVSSDNNKVEFHPVNYNVDSSILGAGIAFGDTLFTINRDGNTNSYQDSTGRVFSNIRWFPFTDEKFAVIDSSAQEVVLYEIESGSLSEIEVLDYSTVSNDILFDSHWYEKGSFSDYVLWIVQDDQIDPVIVTSSGFDTSIGSLSYNYSSADDVIISGNFIYFVNGDSVNRSRIDVESSDELSLQNDSTFNEISISNTIQNMTVDPANNLLITTDQNELFKAKRKGSEIITKHIPTKNDVSLIAHEFPMDRGY